MIGYFYTLQDDYYNIPCIFSAILGGVGDVRVLTADAGRGATLGAYSVTRGSKAAGMGPVGPPHTEDMEGKGPAPAPPR